MGSLPEAISAVRRFPALRVRPGTLRSYLTMSRSEAAIPELDGLRAFAILLVLARHSIRPFWSESEPLLPIAGWDAGIPFINGWMGVDLFFVLSGFLIAHIILRRLHGPSPAFDVRTYLIRRALRIVPAYYVVLLIAALGWIPFYQPTTEWLGVRIAYHALFLQDYLVANIVVVFWSLGVEEKFYLLAPVLLVALLRLPRPAQQYTAVGLLTLCPLLFRYITHLGNPALETYEEFFWVFRSPFHMSFDGLAIGVLCALLYRDRARLAFARNRLVTHGLFWAGLALVGWLIAAESLLGRIDLFDKIALQTVLSAGMGCMLLALVFGGGTAAFMRKGWLFFFSKISYSLYLVHLPLVPGVKLMLDDLVGLHEFPLAVQFAIFAPVFSAVSIAVALGLHYLVEKPFLLIRDQLVGRRTRATGRLRSPGRPSMDRAGA